MRTVIKTLFDVNALELVGKRMLGEIEAILSNAGHKQDLLWRAADGEWWVHIQRSNAVNHHYDVTVRDSDDEMLLLLSFDSLKQVEQQTPFRLADFRIADAWTHQREWLM